MKAEEETLYRQATKADLPAIVALLLDDTLGAQREQAGDPAYERAFDALQKDPNQELWVVVLEGQIVGFLQISLVQGLGRRGSLRAQIGSVRIQGPLRNRGMGTAFLQHAIERARARGASWIQLTTDKSRQDALRFYLRLGFQQSHEGLRLTL